MEESSAHEYLEAIRAEIGDCSPEQSFQDLDLDSLDFIDLAQKMESVFSVTIADQDLAAVHTVGDLIACLERLRSRISA